MIISSIGIFLTTLVLVYFSTSKLIKVAHKKHLFDEPVAGLKVHVVKTPHLGGVAIFGSLVLALLLFLPAGSIDQLKYVIAGSFVLFLLGLSDDLAGVSMGKKLTIQLAVSFMTTVLGEFRITNLHGFLGIYEISVVIGSVISILFIMLLINAFNFIDGINYLAGGIGLLVCISFAGFFWAINETGFLLLSIGLCGSLIGFLYYNRTPARIFMGETGSLLLGFVIAVLAIRFMELSQSTSANLVELKSAPAILFGLLIIPLFDTARVFVIRILKGKSPFYGDRNHIHHRLLDIKFSHLQATMILLSVNAGSFCLAYFLRHLGTEILVLLISVYIIGLNWTLSLVTMHKNNKSRNSYHSAKLSKTMDIAKSVNA